MENQLEMLSKEFNKCNDKFEVNWFNEITKEEETMEKLNRIREYII